jgi:hypothetical protein
MHIDPDTKYACWYFSQCLTCRRALWRCGSIRQNRGARADIIGAPAILACSRHRLRLACPRPIQRRQGETDGSGSKAREG